jgi:Mg-chelatase subunit ChlD
MGYIRPWAVWRRIQYGGGVLAVVALVVLGVYYGYFYASPTCFDGIQNGDESGIDCGGECVPICASNVATPEIEWTESFKIASNQYNSVAYVNNPNPAAGTKDLSYTFRFYDVSDQLITERSGRSSLLPNAITPLFAGRVDMLNRELGRTEIVLDPVQRWLPVEHGKEQFSVGTFSLKGADSAPELTAEIENVTLDPAEDVDVVATIFDSAGTPLTASRTFLEELQSRTTRDLTFTWPNPIASTVRSCIVPTDIMMILDRSGSMAADGGDPPEPLESTKRAAQQFVDQTRARDQLGYLSYATTPSSPIDHVLTSDKSDVRQAIADTTMGTDGTQYTNMGAAFQEAFAELRGPRARGDARKAIVFLTDGDVTRPVNPETGERDVPYAGQYARQAAKAAKDAGVTVYTIGFGDFFKEIENVLDRDIELIEDLASDSEKFYLAPTISELEQVYSNIAEDICEDGPTRIDIIPTTGSSFITP